MIVIITIDIITMITITTIVTIITIIIIIIIIIIVIIIMMMMMIIIIIIGVNVGIQWSGRLAAKQATQTIKRFNEVCTHLEMPAMYEFGLNKSDPYEL